MKDGEQDIPLELIETIEAWRVWLLKAAICTIFIACLAVTVKNLLIDPYSMSVIEFEVKVNRLLKSDREELRI